MEDGVRMAINESVVKGRVTEVEAPEVKQLDHLIEEFLKALLKEAE